jgi:predicted phosphodiesterase
LRWTAEQLYPDYEALLASWPKTLRLKIDELGDVLFCHGTPRSETKVFSRLTPADRLLPIFEPLGASVIVCGHTHMQFDRMIGSTRVVNAGSVGMPHGASGAFWVLLGPDVQLRHTLYDLTGAAELIRKTQYPGAQAFAHDILQPDDEQAWLEVLAGAELGDD